MKLEAERKEAVAQVLSWSFIGPPLVLPWSSSGPPLVLPWSFHGPFLVFLWSSFIPPQVLFWPFLSPFQWKAFKEGFFKERVAYMGLNI